MDNERIQVDLTMPETMAAHEWLIDLVNVKKAVPTVDDVLDTHNAMFYSEVLAMDSNCAANVWVGFNTATEGRFTLGHCVWPHGGDGKVGITPSVDATVIYGKTKYPDESWGLAKLLSSFEISKWAAVSESHMTPGAVIDAWHDQEVWDLNPPYKNDAEFWDTLTMEDYGAVPVPANTRKGEYWDTYTNEWVAMREGDAPFNETTAGELEVKLQAIVDKPLP